MECLKLVNFKSGLRSLIIEITHSANYINQELHEMINSIEPRAILIIANKFDKGFFKSFENLRIQDKFLFSLNYQKGNSHLLQRWLP